MTDLPLLAASNWGLAIAIAVLFVIFLFVGYVVLQGTVLQLAWRKRVEDGDVEAIRVLVEEEVGRWKTARTPKGTEPGVWRGVQGAEVVDVRPDGVHLTTTSEGQYAMLAGERREVNNALHEGMKVTAKLADLVLYDIPNVRLPWTRIDVYSTFRDEGGSAQRCVLSTVATRDVANTLDWDETDAEEIVRAFGGRFALDDRGNPLPIDVEKPRASVPAAFYEDE